MIASWMFAATLLGLSAVLAATALERALRLLGRQARIAWVLALGITIGWPLSAPALIRPVETRAQVSVITANGLATGTVEVPALAPRTVAFVMAARATLARLDLPIAILWGAATLLLLLRAGVAVRMLRRLAHRAERRTIDGLSVLVSPSVGPAAFGVLKPRIVLPIWSLDLDPQMRAMVLRHEQEHLAAHDPAVLMLARIGVALMPWNPALWVIARRLRIATELDCDHRVVRQGTDARRYAQLLLLMVQRQAPAALAALMAGSPTTLHQRIDAMHAKAPARPRLRAALLFIAAIIASMVAASPAIASQLAAVRTKFAPSAQGVQGVQQPASPKQSPSNSRTSVLELPLVVVSPDRSVEVPAMQAPAQQPAKRVPADSSARRAAHPPRRVLVDSTSRKAVVDSLPRKVVFDTLRLKATVDSLPRKVGGDSVPSRQLHFDVKLVPVTFAPGGSPRLRYPDILRAAGVSGELIVQVVVDSSGLPIASTIKVVRKSHDLFESSFRDVFSQIRFNPATAGDLRVRQLIQLVYRFDFEDAPPRVVPPMSPTLATFVIDVTARRR